MDDIRPKMGVENKKMERGGLLRCLWLTRLGRR